MTTRSLVAAAMLAIMAVAAAACGGTGAEPHPPGDPGAGPVVGAEPGPAGEPQTCDNEMAGFSVTFPGDWYANAGDGLPACSAFDPRPIELPATGEIPLELAIVITREGFDLDDFLDEYPGEEQLSTEETTVAGRPAVRVEVRAEESAVLPDGTLAYRYYVDLDGETLVAETHDAAASDHEANRRTLDTMLETLELHDR